jgi:hypothetical protein
MLYIGSLLHIDVQTVGYFLSIGTLIGNFYVLQCSINFLINGDARLGFGLLKCDIFRGKSQRKHVSLSLNNVKQNYDVRWYSVSMLVKFDLTISPYNFRLCSVFSF